MTPGATRVFCDVSEAGARIVTGFAGSPRVLLASFLLIAAILAYIAWATRDDLTAAYTILREHPRTFLGIGALAIPIGVCVNLLFYLAHQSGPSEWAVRWFNDTANANLFLATTLGGVQFAVNMYLVTPPVVQGVRLIRDGESPTARRCFKEGFRHGGRLLLALLIVYGTVGGLLLIVFAIPLAIYVSIRWIFFPQAIILDGASSALSAIRLSGHRVSGNWIRTFARTIIFQLLAVLPGPLVGILLLVLGKTSVQLTNLISGVILAFTVPLSVIGLTMIYERLSRLHEAALPPEESVMLLDVLSTYE